MIRLPLIVAADFDGTLCEHKFPKIGKPLWNKEGTRTIIEELLQMRKDGWFLILWTCRQGKVLDEAVEWCKQHGLEFDAINTDHPQAHESFGFTKEDIESGRIIPSRKIFANMYVDDRCVNVADV